MAKKTSVESIQKKYERLKNKILRLGIILQGSINPRTIELEDPKAPGRMKRYGPYYQWTWKRQGQTVNINLSSSQAKAYSKAIKNHRQLNKILEEMRTLSLKILESTTQGVKKRKPRIKAK
jgi:predicted DNA-binding helix-hairpin-helix protein